MADVRDVIAVHTLNAEDVERLPPRILAKLSTGTAGPARSGGPTMLIQAPSARDARLIEKSVELLPYAIAARRARKKRREHHKRRTLEEMVDFVLDGEERDPVETDLRADNIELRREYLATTRCLDAVEVHELSGSRSKDRRATARRWKRQGRVFAIRRSGGDFYPAFQFEDDRPRPAVHDVLAALPDWMGCWQRAFWFASGNGWLGGETPADRLDDPREVVRAACRAGDPAVGLPVPLRAPPRILPPPGVATLPASGRLHRVHLREFAGNGFNPCRGGPTRFAPIQDASGKCVPSLYAGSTLEAAIFETIFHDIPAAAPLKTVPLWAVEERVHSVLETRRDMRLAELRAPDLLRWGVNRHDLIESEASSYAQTAAWAAAIHRCFPDIDGLVWTSRRCDPDSAYLFFGDRARASDFSAPRACRGAAFVAAVRTVGRRAGIAITIP